MNKIKDYEFLAVGFATWYFFAILLVLVYTCDMRDW